MNTKYDSESIKILASEERLLYQDECRRREIIFTKTGISFPIIATYVFTLIQNEYFTLSIAALDTLSIECVKDCIVNLIYLLAILLGLISLLYMLTILWPSKRYVIDGEKLYNDRLLKTDTTDIFTLLKAYLYIQITQNLSKQNNDMYVNYGKGLLYAVISLVLFLASIAVKTLQNL